MKKAEYGKILLIFGTILSSAGVSIGLASPAMLGYILFSALPIFAAFIVATYLRRNLGALATGIWLLFITIMMLRAVWTELEFEDKEITGYLFAAFFIPGVVAMMLSLKPERGHVSERVKIAIYTISLLAVVFASNLYPPEMRVAPYIAIQYTNYQGILLMLLTTIFTASWIIIAHLRRDFNSLILKEDALNTVLATFTVGMVSILAFATSAGFGCGCSQCVAELSPGPAMVMQPLIAPSTALLAGHIYATMRQIKKPRKKGE